MSTNSTPEKTGPIADYPYIKGTTLRLLDISAANELNLRKF